MIFLVSNQKTLFEKYSDNISISTVNKCIDYFKNHTEIQVDTETEGFDPHTKRIITLQLGDKDNQFVIDCYTIDIDIFKDLLESKTLLLQNAKFDLRFLYKNHIYPKKVYDTFLAETIIYHGIIEHSRALDSLALRYCNVILNKEIRGIIHREGLSERVIIYAAEDVRYLSDIKEQQVKRAEEIDVVKAIDLENRFVLALAYIEYCGIYLDRGKWVDKINKVKELRIKALDELNNYLIDNNFEKWIEPQLDLFSNKRTVNINWSSSQQVVKLFKELGINTTVFDKKLNTYKDSIEASVLKPQKNDFDILPLYLKFQKFDKEVSTYGEDFLKNINLATGRVHPEFMQLVDTGRLSCRKPNLQNIPATDENRGCFIPSNENNILIDADYSQQEQIVLANFSLDKDLLHFYRSNLGDMHSLVASKAFPELRNTPLLDIKKYHPDKRQMAKSVGFAINYGGDGYTISTNLGISVEEGVRIYNSYMEGFQGLKEYFDKKEKSSNDSGYILINPLTGFKIFIPEFDKYKESLEFISFDNKDFWNLYREEKKKKSDLFRSLKAKVSKIFKQKSSIRKNSLNYPIQGSSASLTKEAVYQFFTWIKNNNLTDIVLIVNAIHDEVLLECPKIMSKDVANKLKYYMEEAAKPYCNTIELKATPVISDHWEH